MAPTFCSSFKHCAFKQPSSERPGEAAHLGKNASVKAVCTGGMRPPILWRLSTIEEVLDHGGCIHSHWGRAFSMFSCHPTKP